MNNHDAAKLSMSQATVHLCPSIFLSTLIILTLSGKKTPPNSESQKTKDYLFLILCHVSSTALTIPLTTQTHLHLPSCSPILCFPSFLSPSSTCFSIHPWLPSTQSMNLWKTNSYPKTNFSSINQRLFSYPYTSLTRSGFTKCWNFFREEHSVLERAWHRGWGLSVQEVFQIQVSNVILRKQQWPRVLSRGAHGAALADEGCHVCWHSKGSRIGCC